MKITKVNHSITEEKEVKMPRKVTPKPIKEDTVKVGKQKWANVGSEGSHGTFRTKKEADAQRKAMFARGYKEAVNSTTPARANNSASRFRARFVNDADYSAFKAGRDYYQSIDNTMEALAMHPDKLANTFDMAKAFGCTPQDVYSYVKDNYQVRFVELPTKTGNFELRESVNEARSYGGAYDIEDDQYFTRDDVNEFAQAVADAVNVNNYSKPVEVNGAYLDGNVLEVILSWNDFEESVSKPISMRRIRKPSDLDKYVPDFVEDFRKYFTLDGADFGEHLSSQDYAYDEAYDDDVTVLDDLFISESVEDDTLTEEINTKKFHFEFNVEGTRSQSTIDALTMAEAEDLLKKQYNGKTVNITKREEVKAPENNATNGVEDNSQNGITEDIDDDFSALTDDEIKQAFALAEVEKPTTDGTPVNEGVGVAGTISALIQDEWEAIDGYNSAIATIREAEKNNPTIDYSAIIKVLTDIVAEENVHVGQLQEALKIVSPNADNIAKGEEEAKKDIATTIPTVPTMATTPVEISTDDATIAYNASEYNDDFF